MSISFIDLQPSEAVNRAREAVRQGDDEALGALDLHFRHAFLRFAQDRGAGPDALRDALFAAWHWVEREKREPWRTQWSYLLELLRDTEDVPALAAELRSLGTADGKAAAVLSLLANESHPLRPFDLADRLTMSPQQVANVCRRLESAELIVRRHGGGRATWISTTRRGAQLVELLPLIERQSHARTADNTSPDPEEEQTAIDAEIDSLCGLA